MINQTFTIVADELVLKYKKDSLAEGWDLHEFVFTSDNKKDLNKDNLPRVFFLNIDNCVREIVEKYNLKNGFVIVSSKHTTSSCFVNHFEKGLLNDLSNELREDYPAKKKWEHNIWDSVYQNADAHLKAIHFGKSATVIVQDGKLLLGDFENMIYAEFDSRPGKSFTVSIFGE